MARAPHAITRILSDLSKIAVDAMSTFSGVKKELETLVSLRVNKIINKMKLVKRDEFEVLKKMVQKIIIENIDIKDRDLEKKKIIRIRMLGYLEGLPLKKIFVGL